MGIGACLNPEKQWSPHFPLVPVVFGRTHRGDAGSISCTLFDKHSVSYRDHGPIFQSLGLKVWGLFDFSVQISHFIDIVVRLQLWSKLKSLGSYLDVPAS